MSADGAYFAMEYHQVALVARQLSEVRDTLTGVRAVAAGVLAVASDGFASVPAALDCANAWLAEAERLSVRLDAARAELSSSVLAYQDADSVARGLLEPVEAGN